MSQSFTAAIPVDECAAFTEMVPVGAIADPVWTSATEARMFWHVTTGEATVRVMPKVPGTMICVTVAVLPR